MTGVTKRWPRAAEPVLADVTLQVGPGEAVGVVGRNGAGKTTLLRIAAGLLAADTGEVRIKGLDPERARTATQRVIGFCSAGNTGLYGRLGVRRHLDLWARLALLPRGPREHAIETMLESFALRELGDQRVDRLSMGQRQRLRLALAFLHEPELLLLDEPRTSLDGEAWGLVVAAIAAARERGAAVVACYPSGDPVLLEDLTRSYVVADGRLVTA